MNINMKRMAAGFAVAGALVMGLVPALAAPAKPKAAPKPNPVKGKLAFKSEGCTACHKTKDFKDGGALGPDLSLIAKNHKAAQIKAYILKPKQGSVMPAFKGPAAVADDMTAYMMTQK